MKQLLRRWKNNIICAGCRHLGKSSVEYPSALLLSSNHVKNCRVLENREKLLYHLPKNAVCAEIGIETAKTSERILKVTEPSKLHLIEVEASWIENARQKFQDEIKQGRVVIHHGPSFDVLATFEDNYFDWIYIDGDHRYEGVKKDLEVARRKTKENGLIWLHDYIFYDHISHEKYGVVEAVNEMCVNHNYEIVFFTFHQQMFSSVVLKKMGA